jgi:RNA polymerase sigma factor (sigma-70 family)
LRGFDFGGYYQAKTMMDDSSLLRRFAEDRSEGVFAELVRRHLNLVYSAALRKVGGDSHLAADVSQKVFAVLARNASSLARHPVLTGWLYTTTHFTAAKLVRAERRRQTREQEAQAMQELYSSPTPEAGWDRLRPVLDDVMHDLNERDREAVLLRFFEGRPFAEVGARLGLSENAARMRVERALDKLHSFLARRGITSTTAALTLLLAEHTVAAAPAALLATVSAAALAGTAGGGSLVLWSFMSTSKFLIGVMGAAVMAVGIGAVVQQQSNAALRDEADGLQRQNQVIGSLRDEHRRLTSLQVPPAEQERLRNNHAELVRLRDEVAALQGRAFESIRTKSGAVPTLTNTLPVSPIGQLDEIPRARSQAAPIYPLGLCFDGTTGEVRVRFTVDANGDVVDATAIKSTEPAFEDSAVEAVRKWKFNPGKKGGQPVNTFVEIPIVYSFRDDPPAKP